MLLGAGTCPGCHSPVQTKASDTDVGFCTLLSPNHRMLWDIFTHSLQVLLGGVESTCRAWAPQSPLEHPQARLDAGTALCP